MKHAVLKKLLLVATCVAVASMFLIYADARLFDQPRTTSEYLRGMALGAVAYLGGDAISRWHQSPRRQETTTTNNVNNETPIMKTRGIKTQREFTSTVAAPPF